jgi:methylase of polypeptide subunit release factors
MTVVARGALDIQGAALLSVGAKLKESGYRFTAVTPDTHERVVARRTKAATLTDIFGWNLTFHPESLDPGLVSLLETADALEIVDGRAKSKVRFATIGDLIFVHSGFPTDQRDAVFFGPDTYRFVRAMKPALPKSRGGPLRLVDVGCGSGAGGIYAASLLEGNVDLVLADINDKALAFSAVNSALNDCPCAVLMQSDILQAVPGDADIIVANPPFLVDAEERVYRHGGGPLGLSLATRILEQSLGRLRPGGRLILYTGVPIVRGDDPFLASVQGALQLSSCQYSYEEVDPDIFGEELDKDVYAAADRIAAVLLTVIKE